MKDFEETKRVKQRYHQEFIKQVVHEVESGATQISLTLKYDLGPTTVRRWMHRYGSKEYYDTRIPQMYSDSVKRQVVHSIIEMGMSVKEASIVYNIRSISTINNWLLVNCNKNTDICIEEPISNEMPKKTLSPEELEIITLKKALAESQFKVVALNTLIDVAEKSLDIEIRKKSGSKQLKK